MSMFHQLFGGNSGSGTGIGPPRVAAEAGKARTRTRGRERRRYGIGGVCPPPRQHSVRSLTTVYDGRVPDWSYRTVLRPLMLAAGAERSRRLATGTLSLLSRIPFGLKLIDFLGHMHPDA